MGFYSLFGLVCALPLTHGIGIPSPVQLAWHEDEIGAMITATLAVTCINSTLPEASDLSCNDHRLAAQGLNVPKPSLTASWNPYKMNATEWVQASASFGATYIILAVNQKTGFAFWDTKANNYSIAHTQWQGGGHDFVKEFVDACRAAGIKPGLFYATRENWYYGIHRSKSTNRTLSQVITIEEFDDICVQQISELYNNYGKISEIWWDGGLVVSATPKLAKYINDHGKDIMCHGCAGVAPNPCQWMGNEDANQALPNFGTDSLEKPNMRHGVPDGDVYNPKVCDTVIRNHIWGYINGTDKSVKTPRSLVHNYLNSVGRNSKLMLNLNPTYLGDIPELDLEAYKGFDKSRKCLFSNKIAGAKFTSRMKTVNGKYEQAWPVKHLSDNVTISIREDITQGQLIGNFTVSASDDGKSWNEVTVSTVQNGIGYKRIFAAVDLSSVVNATQMKLVVTDVVAENLPAPGLRDVELFDWGSRAICV